MAKTLKARNDWDPCGWKRYLKKRTIGKTSRWGVLPSSSDADFNQHSLGALRWTLVSRQSAGLGDFGPRARCPWWVFRVSELSCTGTGLRRQVFRLTEPACRQTATGTREICHRKPKTPARGDSNSENLPRSREIAARRPGSSENPPPRHRPATRTRKSCHQLS